MTPKYRVDFTCRIKGVALEGSLTLAAPDDGRPPALAAGSMAPFFVHSLLSDARTMFGVDGFELTHMRGPIEVPDAQ